MKTSPDIEVHERLISSDIFKHYEEAFGETTGLPLTLSPVEDWHLAHHGRRHENPFCALMAKQNKACAACLRVQNELSDGPDCGARTVACFAGLSETAVPLRIGERLIGYLRTGEVLHHAPTHKGFEPISKQLKEWGVKDVDRFEAAYLKTQVVSQGRYDSIVHLLEIFAEHLAMVANQVVFRNEHSESPQITRARQFIDEHKAEEISLKRVSAAANMSTFYFCKKFHQAMGCTFTEYLSRVRIEAAKTMLMNPHARVTEVAFDSGFQSITHFNRMFKQLVGQSPTEFRAKLAKAA